LNVNPDWLPLDLNTTQLLQEADRCVKCGLCLAVCPTYQVLRNEGDSPRGRIALIQGLAMGELSASPALGAYLRRCLHCLNCQRACPSEVRYQQIIDAGLARLPNNPGWELKPLTQWTQSRWLPWLTRLFQRSGLWRLTMGLSRGGWRRQLELFPATLDEPIPLRGGPVNGNRLFLGCVGRLTDRPPQRALLDFCQRMGLELSIPQGQTCCGAMHQHQGDLLAAERYGAANDQAFAGAEYIVGLSSGCGAALRERFGPKVLDASDFLQRHWPDGIELSPLAAVVAVHTPCSLRNGLGSERQVWRLLERIPGTRLIPLDQGFGCCGGAGRQLIEQPVLADALLEPLLAQIAAERPRIIVTSNTGCALHLKRGLARRGLPQEVLHPVELIARQWPSTTMKPARP
jgi:glycolate oxidase iron-sulfur subunit